MLEEKFRLLDEKISGILEEVKRLRSDNAELLSEIDSLREQAGEADALREEIAECKEKIQAMEQDAEANVSKEQEVLGRLRTIVEKIDSLEQEAGDA